MSEIAETLDEKLKKLFADKIKDDDRIRQTFGEDRPDLVDLFAKIKAYKFNYNDIAKALYPNGKENVDNDEHVGVMAQELEANPVTSAAVETDPKTGLKTVNAAEMTMADTAVISELCRRIELIEKKLGL